MIYLLFILNLFLIAAAYFIQPSEDVSKIVLISGRFHPLFLHLPIGLFLLLPLFESLGKFAPLEHLKKSAPLLLWLTAITSLLSAVSRYLLYLGGDYGGEVIEDHLRGGIALSMLATCLIYIRRLGDKVFIGKYYSVFLFSAIVLLFYTSHNGGTITHGEGFLTEHLFGTEETSLPEVDDSKFIYEDIIVPILKNKCANCHNEKKKKGKLRVDSYEFLLKGGENDGPAIVAGGKPEDSSLYYRITLPHDDEDVMPPSDKKQLTTEEKILLCWWIEQGALKSVSVESLNPVPEIQEIVDRY